MSWYAGARRFVFNWALARRKQTYEQCGTAIPLLTPMAASPKTPSL
jgi:Helix-turn-helix domain